MFVRFRRSHHRLKVYIAENARRDGKVRQETIAYLGSIEAVLVPTLVDDARERESIAARIAFWEIANPKLKNLANRLGPDQQRLRMRIHERIPWPMQPERDRLEALKAEHEGETWHKLYQHTAKMIERNKKLAAKVKAQNEELRRDAQREIDLANTWAARANELRHRHR